MLLTVYHFQDPKIVEMLAPIIQAAQLLQARKTEDDVASVCDMCNKLTTQQVCHSVLLFIVRFTQELF